MRTKVFFTIMVLIVTCSVYAQKQQHAHGESKSQTFQVGKGGRLEVAISSGDIHVSSWQKSEVSVKVEGLDPEELDQLKMTQTGDSVRVTFRPEWGSHHVRFTFQIPVDYNTDLHTSGGDIQLQGTFRGLLEGSTSGGDIRLGDVEGKVDMSTSGGDVSAGKITGTVQLRTSGGDIRMTNCSGDVDVSTSGGNIMVGNVGKTLNARTAGGDIEVGDVGGEATISTAGGDIRVGKVTGSVTMKTAGGDIILRGGSGMIRGKTAGGDINMQDLTGSVEASTAGGDVTAQLRPSGKGRSRLSSSGGDVVLYVPANAKANIDALIDIHGRWEEGEYQIVSDFKSQTYDADASVKEIHGTYVLNGGGEQIFLETTNGNIYIRTLR